jgi:hypothetical protein
MMPPNDIKLSGAKPHPDESQIHASTAWHLSCPSLLAHREDHTSFGVPFSKIQERFRSLS